MDAFAAHRRENGIAAARARLTARDEEIQGKALLRQAAPETPGWILFSGYR